MPIYAPKIVVFGGLDPYNGQQYEQDPKRHFLAWKHVVRHLDCQNRTTDTGSVQAKT